MCIVFLKEELRDDPLQNTTRLLTYDQGRSGLAWGRSRIESVLLAASFANFKGHYYVLRSAKATCKVLSNLVLPTREVLHISLGTISRSSYREQYYILHKEIVWLSGKLPSRRDQQYTTRYIYSVQLSWTEKASKSPELSWEIYWRCSVLLLLATMKHVEPAPALLG